MIRILFQRLTGAFLFIAVLAIGVPSATAAYTNGIYAEFNTSMGSYTCRLEYAMAPKAVANFIGLATGQRAWLDLPTGLCHTNPFYNGTTFHRVIAGFMNQGGSPNALGTDGPGYQFVDEFTNSLRFDGFGLLAMANSGPDSNGSQYFITVSPQTQLNDVHTIFGKLYGGSNVVYAINHVATDANDKPLTNVVVQTVIIRRVGTAADAFDINAQGLPVVTNLNLAISPAAGANVNIAFTNQLNWNTRIYYGTNLFNWAVNNFGYETSLPVLTTAGAATVFPQQFFRGAQVRYPPTLFVPRNVFNRVVTLNITGSATFVVSFDGAGLGTYTWTGGSPGTVQYYSWIQDPYRGRLAPLFLSGIVPLIFHLDFDSSTAGTFKGQTAPNYPSLAGGATLTGTFSVSP